MIRRDRPAGERACAGRRLCLDPRAPFRAKALPRQLSACIRARVSALGRMHVQSSIPGVRTRSKQLCLSLFAVLHLVAL
jgi:hypothetical protein